MKVDRIRRESMARLASPTGIGGTRPLPALDDLSDVDLTGVADGDTIVFDDATDTWVPGTTPGGSSLPWFVVTDYGAVGDGSTDDLTAINSAIAAYNAAGGGVLYFPAVASGDYYYVSNALTALTMPGLVLGDGSGSDAASPVATDHGTANLFTVSSDSVTFRALRLVHFGAAPSAGAAIATTTGNGSHCRYEHLWVESFFDGMDLVYGAEWAMYACHILNPVTYGVRIANIDVPDGGDWSIVTCWFGTKSQNATSAIRQESGGGGKIVNLKINCNSLADQGAFGGIKRYVTGIDLSIGSGANTIILTVANSSIENVSGDAVAVATTGTGQFGSLMVDGLQVGLYSPNNTGRAVKVTAASAGGHVAGGIYEVLITDSVFATTGTARAAVELTNPDNVLLGDLVLFGFNARYTSSGATNVVDNVPPTFATPAIVLGTAAAAGAAATVIRSDSTIVAFDATAPVTQAFGDAAATGAAAVAARRDHRHGMPSGAGGEILISDTPSTPLVFADLIQNEAQDDLVYADP